MSAPRPEKVREKYTVKGKDVGLELHEWNKVGNKNYMDKHTPTHIDTCIYTHG